MLDQHIKQLKSLDWNRRSEAIRALAESGDPRAVDPLKYAARTDPDPRLRDMAVRAIRRIEAPAPAPQAPDPKPAITPLPRPIQAEAIPDTGEESRQRAERHFKRAFEHRMKGESRDAIAELAEALRIDPGLASDNRTLSLAADLTAEPPEQAIQSLIVKSRQRGVRRSRATFGRDARIFTLELLVLLGALVVVMAVFNAGLVDVVRKMLDAPINPEAVETQMASVFKAVRPVDFLTALPVALLTIATLIVWDSVIFVAGGRMGGTGTILGLLKWLMAVQIASYVIAVLLQPVVLLPALAAAPRDVSVSQTLTSLSAAISVVCLGLGTIAQSYLTGREHRIGFVRGFMSVAIADLICFGFWAILSVFTFGR
jgi:HEAT repeat protein